MYVVKYRQIVPVGNWQEWQDGEGHAMLFDSADSAERYASGLRSDRKNIGYGFKVMAQTNIDPEAKAAFDRRSFQV